MPQFSRLTMFYLGMFVLLTVVVTAILWSIERFLGVEISPGAGAAMTIISAMLAGQMFRRWEGRTPRLGEAAAYALWFTILAAALGLLLVWLVLLGLPELQDLSPAVFWGAFGVLSLLNFLVTWGSFHFGARQEEKLQRR